ncbi:GNAT family N-acetyltransferase [Flavobacterium selenitireducens]|uniref:GNAT family N-acetyltransferase n=1 Tax=Flavobacterium selenitireducens TaxID=2722704 RepID=UPI00168BF49D|nr:GNAT family N-acetyltransferase [Flavobacterium selenitireducens]MBD3582368.1 N-acetyltransferase [Flavobacterium selenitireducens]
MEFYKNEAQSQFELHLKDDAVAFVEYADKDDKIYLTHTEVPQSHRGQGIAQQLVERTLSEIKQQGKTLVPLCSFVSKYVDNHSEWHPLLSEGYQM